MTKVFVGGSRAMFHLTKDLTSRLDNIIEKKFAILVGDANGADKAVQKHLFEKGYKNVVVYCLARQCRNNIGNWPVENVHTSKNSRNFEDYSARDLAMAKEADYGFMVWDAKSKGTLKNIITLLKLNKKTLVFFYPEKNFYVISTLDNLKYLLAKCSKESMMVFEQALRLSDLLKTSIAEQPQLDLTYEGP